MGPKKTLRFVAQYGDACNFFGGAEDDVLLERLEVLKEHCQNLGRPYEEIEKTVLQTANLQDSSAREVIDRGLELQKMGFEHLIFNIRDEYTPESLQLFTDEIIPVLKG
jgi:alkanesulfonate monooxygenase